MPILYDLTPLTGREASENRRTVVLGHDMSWDFARAAVLGAVPGLLVFAATLRWIGVWGLGLGAATAFTIGALLFMRGITGLRLKLWRQLWNKTRAANGRVFLNGRHVDPEPPKATILIPSLTAPPM